MMRDVRLYLNEVEVSGSSSGAHPLKVYLDCILNKGPGDKTGQLSVRS